MKLCSTLEEFNNILDNYKTSGADISIKEKAINELFKLNKSLLEAPRIDTTCTITIDDID